MLPATPDPVPGALERIERLQGLGRPLRIRAGLADGTMVEGVLISATATDLALQLKDSHIVNFGLEEIRSLALGRPHGGRYLALGLGGLAAGTAAVVGLGTLPVVRTLLEFHSNLVVGTVFYAVIAAFIVLLGTTGLRGWLVRWKDLTKEGGQGSPGSDA